MVMSLQTKPKKILNFIRRSIVTQTKPLKKLKQSEIQVVPPEIQKVPLKMHVLPPRRKF